MVPANYTREEERLVADRLAEGAALDCPRCGASLERQSVPPRPDMAYVRDRVWLVCRACRRSMVLEKPREED